MKIVGYIVSWLGVIVLGSLFYGFALATLWGWFLVPALHAAPISIPQAIGISLVVNMFTARTGGSEKKENKEPAEVLLAAAISAFLVPLIVLIFGAVIHLFVS